MNEFVTNDYEGWNEDIRNNILAAKKLANDSEYGSVSKQIDLYLETNNALTNRLVAARVHELTLLLDGVGSAIVQELRVANQPFVPSDRKPQSIKKALKRKFYRWLNKN